MSGTGACYYALGELPEPGDIGRRVDIADRPDDARPIGEATYRGLFIDWPKGRPIYFLCVEGRELTGVWTCRGRRFVPLDSFEMGRQRGGGREINEDDR